MEDTLQILASPIDMDLDEPTQGGEIKVTHARLKGYKIPKLPRVEKKREKREIRQKERQMARQAARSAKVNHTRVTQLEKKYQEKIRRQETHEKDDALTASGRERKVERKEEKREDLSRKEERRKDVSRKESRHTTVGENPRREAGADKVAAGKTCDGREQVTIIATSMAQSHGVWDRLGPNQRTEVRARRAEERKMKRQKRSVEFQRLHDRITDLEHQLMMRDQKIKHLLTILDGPKK
jgi:hypothetical protein